MIVLYQTSRALLHKLLSNYIHTPSWNPTAKLMSLQGRPFVPFVPFVVCWTKVDGYASFYGKSSWDRGRGIKAWQVCYPLEASHERANASFITFPVSTVLSTSSPAPGSGVDFFRILSCECFSPFLHPSVGFFLRLTRGRDNGRGCRTGRRG